jgi:hypothetical protein
MDLSPLSGSDEFFKLLFEAVQHLERWQAHRTDASVLLAVRIISSYCRVSLVLP